MGKKPVIKLRTYRGTEINYDANKNIKNENNLVSLFHGDRGWILFMKNLPLNGLCKVVVEKGFNQLENGEYEEIKDLSVYQKEVDAAFKPTKEVPLTEADKKIAELTAKLEAFMSGGDKKQEKKEEDKKEENDDSDETLTGKQKLQAEYTELANKRPFHGWSEEQLKEKIQALK